MEKMKDAANHIVTGKNMVCPFFAQSKFGGEMCHSGQDWGLQSWRASFGNSMHKTRI